MKTSKLFAFIAVASIALISIGAHAAGINISSILSPDMAMGLSVVGAAGITTYKQEGGVLSLTPTAAVVSGAGYLFGTSLFGIATNDVAANDTGEFLIEGVVSIGKTSALAIAVGDRVFWDAANSVVNKTAAAQHCVGIAIEAAANPSSTVTIRLGSCPPVAA